MLNDTTAMNPKGHVKLELYNDEGVFFTKEKHNLVVQSANEIVAKMMQDPAKVMRVDQKDEGASALSTSPVTGLYEFDLNVQSEQTQTYEINWGQANIETEFTVESLAGLTSLDSVKAGETDLVLDQDVFLLDAEKGIVRFAVAPLDLVVFKFHKPKNKYMKIISGTEKVTVAGEVFTRATVANHEEKKYQIDYRTGKVQFKQPVQEVVVEYSYNMNYSLGFMALGGKPNANHENYQPVEFGQSEKLLTMMANELPGSRMPVQYPASLSDGPTEMEPSIPTQPVKTVLAPEAEVTIVATQVDGVDTKTLVYAVPNVYDSGTGANGRSLYELVSVVNTTTSADILARTTVKTNTLALVELEFQEGDVFAGDKVKVSYRLKLDNSHLTYPLGQAPVMKLVNVRFTDANDSTQTHAYEIVAGGLRPNEGDVWISNPNTGHITFSSSPNGGPEIHNAGFIYVEYMINAGKTVKFVADFPKGVPAPTIVTTVKEVTVTEGQTSVTLDSAVAKDVAGNFFKPVVKIDGTQLADAAFSLSTDGRTITPTDLSAGQVVEVTYKYEKSIHDVYQVAMFDQKSGGTMFNISGIGPVTKDKNTGMRLSWSVTF